jgi:hypothetical protein
MHSLKYFCLALWAHVITIIMPWDFIFNIAQDINIDDVHNLQAHLHDRYT